MLDKINLLIGNGSILSLSTTSPLFVYNVLKPTVFFWIENFYETNKRQQTHHTHTINYIQLILLTLYSVNSPFVTKIVLYDGDRSDT